MTILEFGIPTMDQQNKWFAFPPRACAIERTVGLVGG